MNKKGSGIILDMLIGMVMIFILAVFIVTAVWFHSTIKTETDIYQQTETGTEILTYIDTTVQIFNFIFVMSIASIIVGLLISAHYIQTSPMFLVVGIIIIAIIVLVSAPLSNTFAEISDDPEISQYLSGHTTVTTLMDNFPLINLLTGSLFLIVLYAKKRAGEANAPIHEY